MTSQSRRDLLKKTLAIGTAAYVAPKLVGQVTTVHAQTLSGNICTQLDSCESFSCGQGSCACVTVVNGPSVCVSPSCGAACATTSDCPSGWVCFTRGCCGDGTFCVPLCFGAPSVAPQDRWKH
ncbi:MAG: hypothetical protein IPL75_08155 [Acidobacteria bacterium]|nr:hypothetical protein [Acidobacteriota bacterium]